MFNEAYIDMPWHPAIYFKLKKSLHRTPETAVNHVYQSGTNMKGFCNFDKMRGSRNKPGCMTKFGKSLSTWDYIGRL